ncbi:HAMP domain-containing sensor histidine kinase [Streptomyces sp. SL13]|uniref:histidine kinase n=1 Tax=Streptantibioticus silvisoli TaxID=2705255 RepID=A0AA90GYR1_9ACTN|nr:HAMP domain-containing sensor histidine kinase [Streptantibioticus silvisoli]MDI5967763.1 HAMP domain-containing sensor histidine kinase [Streptantibioticus silvisoli]
MRPPLPRTLRARLTAGLVTLLALACATVGVVTVFSLEGFLVRQLDQNLTADHGRFADSLEHESHPDTDSVGDTRGQADRTLGARLLPGTPPRAALVRDTRDTLLPLTAHDRRVLAAVPVDGTGHRVELSTIGAYQVLAIPGDDGDTLVTGLPLHPVMDTVHRLEAVEAVVFGGALLVTGVAAAGWVTLSLRPLRRVTRTAAGVAELPLASGRVAMPAPVPDTDPRTEVGQVGAAVNRMLGHVGDALARRHAVQERLRQFAADASHELRTPVATVRGHAELALRHPGPLPDEVRHALERIGAESRRMSALVDDLLLLARLDAGRPLAREPVDLTRLALDAGLDARATGPGHRWTLDLPPDAVTVTGDEHRLQQVVTNLLTNARVHTPPGTAVTLRVAESATTVELTVRDDGPGIPQAIRSDIFDRFVRADHGRSRAAGGTGLGLAIVAAVVAAHDGTIDLTGEPGHTAFHVVLPRDRPSAPRGEGSCDA